MKPGSLTRSDDFRRVYGEGIRTRRNGVSVAVLARGDEGAARVGYSVTRAAGGAVVRNRIKRRLRAAVGALEVRPGVDVVVGADARAASTDFQDLVQKLSSGLRAVGAVE